MGNTPGKEDPETRADNEKFDNELRSLLGIPKELWDKISLPERGADIVTWMKRELDKNPDLEHWFNCLFTLPDDACGSLFKGALSSVIPCWWSGFWIEKYKTDPAFQELVNRICDPTFGLKFKKRPCGGAGFREEVYRTATQDQDKPEEKARKTPLLTAPGEPAPALTKNISLGFATALRDQHKSTPPESSAISGGMPERDRKGSPERDRKGSPARRSKTPAIARGHQPSRSKTPAIPRHYRINRGRANQKTG